MASVKLTMQATGIATAKESCTGCDRSFRRGETMSAVEYDNGDPAGWFCKSCIQNWNETIAKGKLPKVN